MTSGGVRVGGRAIGRFVGLSTAVVVGVGASAAQAQQVDNEGPVAIELAPMTVEASQVELTPLYEGGQVATGSRAGMLGNLDFLDMPFSGTAYSQELIENQQTDSVGDVLLNDPTVRVAKGFGNFQEVYLIRGFPLFSDDITLNGLYGILPRQFVAAGLMERVEVFRGPSTFTNGAAPGSSAVGGTVNLVPKRAPQGGIRSVTGGYESDEQAFGSIDFGERFGENDAWGIRVGAIGRTGETAIEREDRSLVASLVGLDYAGERLRFSLDLGYQDHRIDEPRPQVTPLGDVPDPPDASANYAQPWTYSDEEQLFGAARGEFDLSDSVTAWLAAGARRGDEANELANPTAAADGTLRAYRFVNTREDTVYSGDGGVRASFDTGPVGHRVVVSGSATHYESRNAFAFSDFARFGAGSLDDPVAVDPPPANALVGGDLDDPLKTEETTTKSIAIADTLSFFDDRVHATIGVRYQEIDTRTFDVDTGRKDSEVNGNAFTPAFGLVVQPLPELAFFANYAEALQRGEVAPAVSGGMPVLNAGEALDPYVSEQFEIGAKYDAGTFGATLSLFSITQQQAIVEDQIFSASGEQRNRGVEVTVFGEPLEGVRLLGGFTYVDAELHRTAGRVNEGNSAVGVPEFQASLNAEWDVPFVPGLTLDGRVIYTGEQFVDAANTIEADDWARLDLGLRYALTVGGADWTLRARVENVTDEEYWASVGGFPGANYLVQGAPLTFVASLNARF